MNDALFTADEVADLRDQLQAARGGPRGRAQRKPSNNKAMYYVR